MGRLALAALLLVAAPALAGGARIVLPGDVLNPLANALPVWPSEYYGAQQAVFEYEWLIGTQPPRPVLYTINGQPWGPIRVAPGWCVRLADRTWAKWLRGRLVWEERDETTGHWAWARADCTVRPDLCPRVQMTGGTGSCPPLNRYHAEAP